MKNKQIHFRLTEAEFILIKTAAKIRGLTVTNYIRCNLEQQAKDNPDLILAYLDEIELAA